MRLGLIARADNSGLGVQTYEAYQHLNPAKTMVIDVGHLFDGKDHCNKQTFRDRYPDGMFVDGWTPSPGQMAEFLKDLDVVFTCETPYSWDLLEMARRRGIKTVLQYNWEFLAHLSDPELPKPDLFAAPTPWHYDEMPFDNKVLLPVPVATERFELTQVGHDRRKFLHIVGRPAIHDRNGTMDLAKALMFVTEPMDVWVRCQDMDYARKIFKGYSPSPSVNLTLIGTDNENYWDNYWSGDVLVQPRRFGGLCLPMQEGLAAGMPVVMPNIDPNNEFLPDAWLTRAAKYCYHCGAQSFSAKTEIELHSSPMLSLAQMLDRFAGDSAFYSRSAIAAKALAETISWNTLKENYIDVFEGLLEGRY